MRPRDDAIQDDAESDTPPEPSRSMPRLHVTPSGVFELRTDDADTKYHMFKTLAITLSRVQAGAP